MQNLSQVTRLRRAVDPAPELAGFDADSGLAGRGLFLGRVEQQWHLCARAKQPLGVLVIAIDGIDRGDPQMEDSITFGQDVRAIGRVVSRWCRRRADFAGRVRKQEMAVMLAESQQDGIREIAQHIIDDVRDLELPNPVSPGTRLTVSMGGIVTVPAQSRMARSLLVLADRALSDARDAGGNRVVFYGDDVPLTH